MGNVLRKISSDPVDGGKVKQDHPSGDYDAHKVQRLIVERKLAPFYEGQADSINLTPPSPNLSTLDDRSNVSISESEPSPSSSSQDSQERKKTKKKKGVKNTWRQRHRARKKSNKLEIEAFLRDCSAECPICFLYYPHNINQTECCNQNLCTACFVSMRRPPSGRTLSCPFCNRRDFGVNYVAPGKLLQSRSNNGLRNSSAAIIKCESIRPYRPPPSLASNNSANYRAAISRHYWYRTAAPGTYYGAMPGDIMNGGGGSTIIVGYNRNGVPMYAPARSYRPQRTVWYQPYQPPVGYSYPLRRPADSSRSNDQDYSTWANQAMFEAIR